MKAGRHNIAINRKLLDKYLEAGCTVKESAPHFGVHEDTLYRYIERETGMLSSDYAAQMRAKGDAILKVVQHEKALSGDNTMLVWLGKNRLKQRDKHDITTDGEKIEAPKIVSYDAETAELIKKTLLKKNG